MKFNDDPPHVSKRYCVHTFIMPGMSRLDFGLKIMPITFFIQPGGQNLLVKYLKICFSLRKDVDYAFVRVKTVALYRHYLSAVADQAGAPTKDR